MVNIKEFTNKLLEDIKGFNKITLFVHVTPDCDAIGSAYAMLNFIKTNFNKKQVRIAGLNKLNTSYLPTFFQTTYDIVDENFVNNSLGIVFDTANYERIYDKQFFQCKKTYRIDHHLLVEKICNNELIDQNASSTCELVGLIFKESKLKMNSEIANSLYFGLLTDTIRFLTSNVNKNTYLIMSYLESLNVLNKKMVHDQLYLRSIKDAKLDQKFSKFIHYKNDYALMIFNKRQVNKYGANLLKSKLFLMSGLKEIKIYCLIYYDLTLKIYKGSLRSRDYNVNLIAKKFNGGGHKYASGFKLNNKSEIKLLETEIKQLLLLNEKYV